MKNRTVIMIFVVCFLSTVAFNYWRQSESLPSNQSESSAALQDPVHSHDSLPTSSTSSAPPQQQRSAHDTIGAAPTEASDPVVPWYPSYAESNVPRDPATSEVPVIVSVEDSASTGRREAIIRNLTPQSLEVRVTSINPASGSRTIVETALPPRRRTNLTDQGLAVTAGSQIVVESPPYLQQSTVVY